MTRAHLGEFEILVLTAVAHLGDNAYGVTVSREIEGRTGRTVSVPAVHTTLLRLEKKELVSSRVGEPTAQRGGRARRYFRLQATGAEALTRAYETLDRMKEGLVLP